MSESLDIESMLPVPPVKCRWCEMGYIHSTSKWSNSARGERGGGVLAHIAARKTVGWRTSGLLSIYSATGAGRW